MKKIAAVVVTFNRLELLKECLENLSKQETKCDIVVVNNASNDGTFEYLNSLKWPNLYVEHLKENTGGAGGFNHGMKVAYQMGYDYIWIMDDDCLTLPDSLANLMAVDKEYGFLSSKVVWTDGNQCVMNRQKSGSYFKQYPMDCAVSEIKQATFVSLLFPRETIEKVGLPIKDFFIWGDDIEYTRRITVRNGIPGYLVSNSVVVHKTNNNVGSNLALDDFARLNRYRLAYRNERYVYRQEGIKGRFYYFCKCYLHIVRIIVKAKDHRLGRLSVLFGGLKDGRSFSPNVERV